MIMFYQVEVICKPQLILGNINDLCSVFFVHFVDAIRTSKDDDNKVDNREWLMQGTILYSASMNTNTTNSAKKLIGNICLVEIFVALQTRKPMNES